MKIEINGIFHEIANPDNVFQEAFHVPVKYRPFRRTDNALARCSKCGEELGVYYCEDQLYAIRCEFCGIVSLVKADSPMHALQAVGDVLPDWKVIT